MRNGIVITKDHIGTKFFADVVLFEPSVVLRWHENVKKTNESSNANFLSPYSIGSPTREIG